MSLYKHTVTNEIKEIDDTLYNDWVSNNNPKADFWQSYTPPIVRVKRERSIEPSKSGLSIMTDGFLQELDSDITDESLVIPSPGFSPNGRIYWDVQAGIGFTIISTDNTDSGKVSWTRHIPIE